MKMKLEAAIMTLAEMITATSSPDEALKYTQAALNLAHADATLAGCAHLFDQPTGVETPPASSYRDDNYMPF